MNPTQYSVFLKIIELGNLTRAAEALGYTQSGISYLLDTLEKECGFTLLLRDRSGIQLTAEGAQLVPHFQSICREQRNLIEKLNEIGQLKTGLIRIGTFPSISAQWLPGIIADFRTDFPGVRFELLHGTDEENAKRVVSGRTDCAFLKIPIAERIDTIFLKRDPLVVILPENHKFADAPSFPMSALSKEPFIQLVVTDDDKIAELFKQYQIRPNTQFVEKDDYAIIAMVEKGLGISILPELIVEGSHRRIVYKQLETPVYRDLGIAVRDMKTIPALTKEFLRYVQLCVKGSIDTNSDTKL